MRRLLESGQLPGKRLGHDWIVSSLDYKQKRKTKLKRGKVMKIKQYSEAKRIQKVKHNREIEIGSSGMIRTYDLAVNSRPLYR